MVDPVPPQREDTPGKVQETSQLKVWFEQYRAAVEEICFFIEPNGKPVDGFRFRDCAMTLKNLNDKYPKTEQQKYICGKGCKYCIEMDQNGYCEHMKNGEPK